MPNSKSLRWIELILFFIGFPVLYTFIFPQVSLFYVLLAGMAIVVIALLIDGSFRFRDIWKVKHVKWKPVFLRFLIFAAITAIGVYFFTPDNFLIIFKERPWLMVLIFFFYPIWSAFPQELLFRTYFYHRYHSLFNSRRTAIFINALLFAFAHIIFENWIAIAATFVLSIMVSNTYLNNKSVLASTIEHSLYGNFVYLIGLGEFFYKVSG